MGIPGGCVLLLLTTSLVTAALLERFSPKCSVTCSEGLLSCEVIKDFSLIKPPHSGPVEVSGLDVKPKLCCEDGVKCRMCLLITITLRIVSEEDNGEEASGEYEDEANLTLCISSAPNLPFWKRISFKLTAAAWRSKNAQLTLVEYDGVHPSSSVNVKVSPFNQTAEMPTLNTDPEECKTPKVLPVIDRQWGVVILKETNQDAGQSGQLQMCVKCGTGGTCRALSSSTIPLHSVTPCLCFQVWRNGSMCRSEFCPFTNNTEFHENVMRNVSVSVHHAVTNEGLPVLSWNLSAPCRLEAELWPCRLEPANRCRDMRSLTTRVNTHSLWKQNENAVLTLQTSGVLGDISPNHQLLHCVKLRVEGVITGPWCENDTRRARWSTPVIVTLLVLCLGFLGGCAFRKKLKGWLSKFDKKHIAQGGRGEVLLLHSCASESDQSNLVCPLARKLSKLGFRVSLDLWSQAEVCAVGPLPWLHSKLAHLQKHGGKALLVLSDSALDRARVFWDIWNAETKKNKELPQAMKEGGTNSGKHLEWFSDVFGSALSCIFSDRMKGGDAERFSLVRFESPEVRYCKERVLPELFHGLRLYRLPTEAHRLLAELYGERPKSSGGKLKRMLWLRSASRRLVKETKMSKNWCGESTNTKADTMSVERTEQQETVPLQL